MTSYVPQQVTTATQTTDLIITNGVAVQCDIQWDIDDEDDDKELEEDVGNDPDFKPTRYQRVKLTLVLRHQSS